MRFVLALTALLAAASATEAADRTFSSSTGNIAVQTVASGLVHPWSLAFLRNGRMLVTERPGRMRIVGPNGQLSPPLGNVPKVFAQSQAGLMDVLLARDFERTHTIFACYAEPADGGGRIAVLRARLSDDETPRARLRDNDIPAKRSGLARPQHRLPHGSDARRQLIRHARRSFRA
jgi:glucose/arabinose dehydrogenase